MGAMRFSGTGLVDGPATTYGYDQADQLTSVERPKEGEAAEIKDSYEYNGNGLRTSQTVNGTTTYFAWDMTEELPLILGDGTNSYIYGPGGYPVEQINNKNEPLYLHHDQQGSTRLITGNTGTVEGKCTYGAYGTPTCEGTATTPLGYDGQYTNSDTGLVYLRARYYDPASAQFLTIDPALSKTHEPYVYGGDRPLAVADPTGECAAARTASLNSTAEECKKLLGGIYTTARNLIKRLRQMKENKRGLPPGEVKITLKHLNKGSRRSARS